jgi:sortase
VRQVVFLTDGAIGDEQGLFDTISANRGRSRVFMVGIGSAPNTYLMSRAAELGRGTFTHIGSTDAVEAAMRQLFDKLESPVATNLSVTFDGTDADLAPSVLPDLYRGEPVTVAAKVGAMKGRPADQRHDRRQALGDPDFAEGRRGRQGDLQAVGPSQGDRRRGRPQPGPDQRGRGRRPGAEAGPGPPAGDQPDQPGGGRQDPSRPAGTPLARADLPLNLPAGWDFDVLFGGARHPGADGQADADADQQIAGLDLPQTATDGPMLVMIGLGLLAWAARWAPAAGSCPTGGRRREPDRHRLGAARRRLPFLAPAALVMAVGLALCGQGLWIPAKAALAQVLLERAFARSVATGQPVKPWPWADTWPVARITFPRLHRSVIVLDGASGQALAFGPGHVAGTPDAGDRGTAVYAAHRDTHFALLGQVRPGDEIQVERIDGRTSASPWSAPRSCAGTPRAWTPTPPAAPWPWPPAGLWTPRPTARCATWSGPMPQVLSPEAVALLLHLAFSRVPSAGQPRPRRRLPPLGDRHVGTFEAPGRHRPNLLGRRQHRSDNR